MCTSCTGSSCNSCSGAYYLSGGACLPCHSDCSGCNGGNSNNCTGCVSGSDILNGSSC